MIVYVGRVYKSNSEGHGYYVVMEKTENHILTSPVFWSEDMTFFKYPKRVFHETFEPFDETYLELMPPKIIGQYDFEKLKRWRWINAHKSATNVVGHRRSRRT